MYVADSGELLAEDADSVRLVQYEQLATSEISLPMEAQGRYDNQPLPAESLTELESITAVQNPALRRLQQETAATWAKVRYVDKLPDPTLGANVFGHPIETAAGSQRANLSVMQMIPWLERLDAQAQQACYDAWTLQQMHAAEKLKVIGDLRVHWYKLYVLGKQIEINEANQTLLKSLIEAANARIAAGSAGSGDVLLGTLELSRLDERLVMLRQQVESTVAEINRLAGRPPQTPVSIPTTLASELPDWNYEMLCGIARVQQPAIAAARLRTHASRWGIEVARLKRRPDVSVGAAWYFIDNNRPGTPIVDVGQDAWSVGAQVSVPLSAAKYDAIRDEATWKHMATQSAVQDVEQQFDALLRDLLAQARAAHETATLYHDTILPQSRQTLDADVQALANNTVEFDRVIQDVRNVLTLEVGYHESIGRLATSLARIRQAVGVDLSLMSSTAPTPFPPADEPVAD
ncbi:MAG: TolC family protein [Planctomycetaceae bacterium]|nr:TolC family protein [Planctomycetaceae bacterium]